MPRSTKLIAATLIVSSVASKAPDLANTDAIASTIDDHPARVRQLVTALVKAGVLASVRGPSGGIRLARQPAEITLRQIHEAVEDQPLLAISNRENYSAKTRNLHSAFEEIYHGMEDQLLNELDRYTLQWLMDRTKAS